MVERLLQAIENKGIKKHGRVSRVSEATKYSKAMVSMVFAGEEEMTDKFLRSVCSAYGINEEWVKTGEGDMFVVMTPVELFKYASNIIANRSKEKSKPNMHIDFESKRLQVGDLAKTLGINPDDAIARMREIGIQLKPETGHTKFTGHISTVLQGTRTVPVISKAQAGDFGFWEDVGDAAERIDCPADITDPHAFAFQVEGDSMYPRYKHGEYVIVDTTKTVMNNDDVVVKLADGAVMVKLFKQISGMVFLESYNQAVETIPVLDGDMVRCFKIVCRK